MILVLFYSFALIDGYASRKSGQHMLDAYRTTDCSDVSGGSGGH